MLPAVACGQGRPGLPSRRKKKIPPPRERSEGWKLAILFIFLFYLIEYFKYSIFAICVAIPFKAVVAFIIE